LRNIRIEAPDAQPSAHGRVDHIFLRGPYKALTTKIRWVDPHPSDHVWVLAELQPIPVAPQPPATGNEDWTHGAFYGTRGTFFVDLTGDGRADAVAVNDDGVTVRRNTGHDFGPGSQANEDWTHGSCYASRGSFLRT
jgi:hypothetical protein